MSSSRRSFLKGIMLTLASLGFFIVLPFFFGVADVSAQQLSSDQFFGGEGTSGESFAESLGLAAGPPIQVIIARLIRTVIGFVGVVLVVMLVYGGFLWMTAGGNPTRLLAAKKILMQSMIGAIIVLSSFGIVQFVLSKLVDATGGTSTSSSGSGGTYPDQSSSSSFLLSSFNTQCASAIYNLQLQFVFTKNVDSTTVSNAFSVKTSAGTDVPGTFVTSGKLVMFTPNADCPAPNSNLKCFEPNTAYKVAISSSVLKSKSGAVLQCPAGSLCAGDIAFTTGANVDTTDPTMEMTTPDTGQSVSVNTIQLLQAETKDDTGVSTVDFYADEAAIFTSGLDFSTKGILTNNNVANEFFTDIAQEWNTAGYMTNKSYPVWASALDCAGNQVTAKKVYPKVVAANCDNSSQDTELGETGVDCGGNSTSEFYCGACDGTACTENSQCAGGVCSQGVCVTKPRIDYVSPGDGATGNLVTIGGNGFGSTGGTITFLGTAAADDKNVSAYMCNGATKWSNKEIVVQIPTGAIDGPIMVTTSDTPAKTDQTDDDFGPISADFDVNLIKRPGLCSVVPTNAAQGSTTVFSGLGFGDAKGTSSVYFKDYLSPSLPAWANAQFSAVVPNMSAGSVYTQMFTGDYQCIDAQNIYVGTFCSKDSDCKTETGQTCAKTWCSETLAYCSTLNPCADSASKCESIRVGSNKLAFSVEDVAGPTTVPNISYVESGWKACSGGTNDKKVCATDVECKGLTAGTCKSQPSWGPIGQYVTIYGTNFGTAQGTVHFKSGFDNDALGDTIFPPQCEDGFWTDTSIVVKVPSKFQNTTTSLVTSGLYGVTVAKGGKTSNSVNFEVVDGTPGPAICKLDPVSGPVTTKVDIYGENLGAAQGTVTFFDQKNADYTIWNGIKITDAVVPNLSKSGPVSVKNSTNFGSNSLNFAVGNCSKDLTCPAGTQCCANGTCATQCDAPPPTAHYAYRVSTGNIPDNPTVLIACNKDHISPSPWNGWPDSQAVCLNAAVTAEFSKPMDQATFSDNVLVEKCSSESANPCTSWDLTAVSGNLTFSETSFSWTPTPSLSPNTLYRVTIDGGDDGVKADGSVGGAPMLADFSWQFTTGATGDFCEVGGVLATPSEFTANEQNQSVGYGALLIAKGKQCAVLACSGSNITWSSSSSTTAQVQTPETGLCLTNANVKALEETPVGSPVKIKAKVTNAQNQPEDTADLTIDFSDPVVEAYFPTCSSACINVKPWFKFKADVLTNSITSGSVSMYECQDALCASTELVGSNLYDGITGCTSGTNVCQKSTSIYMTLSSGLKANTWYRIVLNGTQIKSSSNVPLKNSGSNFGSDQNKYYPNDFSWKFKTKTSDISCAIDSISVAPKTKIQKAIGDRQAYTATAYGAPDQCDASGQALQDSDYVWSVWKAEDNPNNVASSLTDVAFMLQGGAIQLAKTLPVFCTANCLNAGALIKNNQAICGDGTVNGTNKIPSEECDGGNSASGDGCSNSCLKEGTSACAPGVTDNCCGNQIVESGEQCDDGNTNNGDGCTSSCLNAGSSTVGTVCGDGVVDFENKTGGEDCDDGNKKNGDGCSSNCLFEGSMAKGDNPICGNATTEPGEDCDDSNFVSGDGCSAQCLHEGSSSTYTSPSVCGNGNPFETGEDCDDGNKKNGDGCSNKCLNEGSSLSYKTPSFCGDKINGIAEECEAASNQTPAIGGFSAAEISQTAPQEVSASGGTTAYSTITATAGTPSKTGTATLGIECSCKSDEACGEPNTLGCGVGSCCFKRPKLGAVLPAGSGPGAQGYCRNTAVSVAFNEQMDATSFGIPEGVKIANIRLRLISKGGQAIAGNPNLCPANYLKIASGEPSGNLFVRAWNWLRSLFGKSVSAAAGDCFVPLTYAQVDTASGQRIDLQYQQLLEPEAVYNIEVVGDNPLNDALKNGVLSENKVGLNFCVPEFDCNPLFVQSFTTSKSVCFLEAVDVVDHGKVVKAQYESASPYLFTKKDETHSFEATALTYKEGFGTFEPIQGITAYNWTWAWGSSIVDANGKNIISPASPAPTPILPLTQAHFASVGVNGTEHAIATATITLDTINQPSTAISPAKQTSGTAEVTALLCEKPWPPLSSSPGFPYIDSESNFGFFYCMDKEPSGTAGDLPSLGIPVEVASVASEGFFQELLFKVEGTPDAIGVRVIPNPNYLSPEAWFKSQDFSGGYQAIEMDGYQAIKSGNTAYVAAANQKSSNLYSNIYVVSFNPNAGKDAKEIFEQILKNWRFNANTDVVSHVGLCKVDAAYSKNAADDFIACTWDGDCVDRNIGGECSASKFFVTIAIPNCPLAETTTVKPFCDSDKSKIQRDLKRLTDTISLIDKLSSYGSKNKHCSVTKNLSCLEKEQCPGTEKCVNGYPTLQQGTFVPAFSVSKWESWNAQFSNALGVALPVDPVNAYWNACTTAGPGYDPATCFNGLTGTFVCPDKSHVYGFQSVGGEAYKLYSQLEYGKAPWNDKIDQSATDDATVVAEYGGTIAPSNIKEGFVSSATFCKTDTVWGTSTICGDGVKGAGEVCELGQTSTTTCTDSSNQPGLMNVTCKTDCKYQTQAEAKTAGAVCVPYQCGNGIVESTEECDDGALNGTYGHCGIGCTLATAFLCGDGKLAGGEQCDCGTVSNYEAVIADPNSWAFKYKSAPFTICAVANGQYNATPTCSYDCKLPGPSCGDKEINGPEQCDSGIETWAGKLCSDGATKCTKDSECPKVGTIAGACGTGLVTNQACGKSKVCVGGTNAGKVCTQANQGTNCPSSTCSTITYDLSRTRTCNATCSWPAWSACFGGDQFCGNGKVEGTEKCDDANTSNNDSCTNACQTNVCGDNFLFDGVESCDNGLNNKIPGAANPCASVYGGTCNYCNSLCQYKTFSGNYCGDGVVNGKEYCDGNAIPKWCVKSTGTTLEKISAGCVANNDCDQDSSCLSVGVCNGGALNGKDCTVNSQCSSGTTCALPICAGDCSAACPFTFQETSILVQSELEGAQPQQNIELYSYLNKEKESPDNALLQLPACLAGTKITANVDNIGVSLPNVDVMFVTDLSWSMSYSPAGADKQVAPNRRIDIVAEATAEAIDTLFNSYPTNKVGKLRIGLVSFGPKDDTETSATENLSAQVDSELLDSSGINKLTLKNKVKNYPNVFGGATPTALGVKKAIDLLKQQPTENLKIVILLSDGDPSHTLAGTQCKSIIDSGFYTEAKDQTFSGAAYCTAEARYFSGMIKDSEKSDGMFFYSAAIATNSTLKAYMEHMSSMKCLGLQMENLDDCNQQNQDGLYAFNGDTKEEIKAMYDQIIETILNATTTVSLKKGDIVSSSTAVTPIGNNVTIPIPPTFQCQTTPFTMPLRTTFYGTGTMKFDEFKFTYCPLP